MIWSFETRTYSECSPSIVLSVLRIVKHFKAVYSVKTQTKANFTGIGATIDVKDVW